MLATSRHLVLSLSTHSSLFYNWVHMQGFDKSTDKLVVLVLVPVVERKGMEVGTALDIQVVQEEVGVEWGVEGGGGEGGGEGGLTKIHQFFPFNFCKCRN